MISLPPSPPPPHFLENGPIMTHVTTWSIYRSCSTFRWSILKCINFILTTQELAHLLKQFHCEDVFKSVLNQDSTRPDNFKKIFSTTWVGMDPHEAQWSTSSSIAEGGHRDPRTPGGTLPGVAMLPLPQALGFCPLCCHLTCPPALVEHNWSSALVEFRGLPGPQKAF